MNDVCEVCGDIGYEHLLLCCRDCKGACTHQYCLKEVLFNAPFGWFCDECCQRHNEGSHSRSVEKVSSERPSNHAQFDSISHQPIAAGINVAVPAPPLSLSTGITRDLDPTGRKEALAPVRCQDFHSACSLEAESGALAVCLGSHVQSKVITHNQPAPEHDPHPPTGSDGGGRASQEQGSRLREGPGRVWQRANGHRDTRTSVGSSETNKELTLELVAQHFSVPIKQAAREMNVGVTILKKHCRKLGITRWPHRKVKSLQKVIENVQRLGKENAQENGHLSESLVRFRQQAMKLFGERPTEELRQVCRNENNAQEDGHLTTSVVEFLQLTKKMIEERPNMILDQWTKNLRQVCFKESFKRKRS